MLIGLIDDAVVDLAVLFQPGAHFAEELARAVRTRIEYVGNNASRLITDAQLFFVNESVVDAINHQLAQHAVFGAAAETIIRDVVAEAERLKEILINNVGARGDDGVNHVVRDHVDEHLLQASADQRAGERENDAAVAVF